MDKFTTLDVLIRSDMAPGFPELFSDCLFDKLCSVCDSKETCGLKVLRLNDEKLIDWLKSGVDRICEAAQEIIHPAQSLQLRAILSTSCGDSAVASFYAENSTAASALTDGNLDTSALQNLAFQIVADKLPGQFIDKLFASLGLVTISNVDKGNIQEQSVVAKKPRFSNSDFHGPTLDYSKRTSTSNPASTQSTARAKLLKKAQGSKSLMSFFGKK
ncbi:unnamed protein product [Hymenolepis diminuta]|nr:unnamed protein product [Hymenolepis diminuta]